MKTLGIQISAIVIIACWTLLGGSVSHVSAEDIGYRVTDIIFTDDAASPVLTIKSDSGAPPTFISYDLFDPLRIVIDIASGAFAEGVTLPIELNKGAVASVHGKILSEQKPVIAKIEILLTEDNKYSIEKIKNDIQITFEAKAASQASTKEEQPVSSGFSITDAIIESSENAASVILTADKPIVDYERVVLPRSSSRPDRMYIDIHGAKAPGLTSIITVEKGPLARLRKSAKEEGTRIVFDSRLEKLFDFSIDTIPEGLQVSINMPEVPAGTSKGNDPIGNLLTDINSSESDMSKSSRVVTPQKSKVAKQLRGVGVSGDAFVDAGYDENRYSVDFYKTNIENVFYLLKELSGRNFVVDDSVSGTVTLYLEKVPWDFILDVVLNLKGLQKVEKFNTIVISPQSKDFSWPEDTVSQENNFEAPAQELVAEIDEKLSQPPEVIESKMYIQKANELAQNHQYAASLDAYKEAYILWPDNIALIKQIASFCLAELNNYICAEDYAGKALAINENDSEAAAQMAISLANMGKSDASFFFDKAVESLRPAPAALLNYAAYRENRGENDQALDLLNRYENTYERTLTTMVAKARIFDKNNQLDKAAEIYEAILMYTGFELPPDLEKFIKGRLALREPQ